MTTRLALPVVLTATFMQLLDVTIVQVAVPSLHRDLDAGQGWLQLVLAGYTLTYACVLIPAARLGDRYGYRRLFVAGLVVFTAASAACAAAPGAPLLVVARLVQGAGSGLMAPQVLSLIQRTVRPDRRGHALGLFGATMGIASLGGPLLGGLLLGTDLGGLGWRLIFLVNLPIGLAALAGATVLPAVRGGTRHRIDLLGAMLAMSGTGLLILPLAVGRDAGWPAWTWLCAAGGAATLAAFVASQRGSREPLLHPGIVRDRTIRTGILLVLVFNAGVPSFSYLLFLYLQTGPRYPPLTAALISAPFAAAAIVGSRASPVLARRLGTRLLTGAAVLLALVMATLAVVVADGGRSWPVPLCLAVGGTAFGAFTASVFTLVLVGVEPDAVGSASGLLPTAQQLGGSIGITLAGLAFFAPAATPAAAFGHALVYEVGIFVLAAILSRRLTGAAGG